MKHTAYHAQASHQSQAPMHVSQSQQQSGHPLRLKQGNYVKGQA